MKLKEACELAEACGLSTIGEALDNIMLHAGMLFSYARLNNEISELTNDYKRLNASREDSVEKYLEVVND